MDDNKVAVLLEDLLSKFPTFGEGLDGLREEMNNRFNHLEQNSILISAKTARNIKS